MNVYIISIESYQSAWTESYFTLAGNVQDAITKAMKRANRECEERLFVSTLQRQNVTVVR